MGLCSCIRTTRGKVLGSPVAGHPVQTTPCESRVKGPDRVVLVCVDARGLGVAP